MRPGRSLPPLPFLIGLFLSLGVPSVQARAQVTPVSREIHQFNSPMVLDFSLDAFLRSPALSTKALSFYSCMGVTIDRLILGLGEKPGQKERELGIVMFFFNNSGKDKQGTVRLDLMEGDERLSTVTTTKLRIEQGDTSVTNIKLAFPASVTSTSSGLKLRITFQLQHY